MVIPATPAEPRVCRLLSYDITARAHHTGLLEGYQSVLLCATVTFRDLLGRQLFARAFRTSAAAGGAWWLGARIDVSGNYNLRIQSILRRVGNAPNVYNPNTRLPTEREPQSESQRARARARERESESERARARARARERDSLTFTGGRVKAKLTHSPSPLLPFEPQVLLQQLEGDNPHLTQVLQGFPDAPEGIFSCNHHYQLACRNFSDTVLSDTPTAAGGPDFPDELVIRVGRCKLHVSNPVLKAPIVSALEAII